MSDAEYRTVLAQIEAILPKWEASLWNIDPGKDERISYTLGQAIVQERDLSLTEVGNIRTYVAAQRVKHTVSGELALAGFLESLFDLMADETILEGGNGLRLASLDNYAFGLSALEIRVKNDAMARVDLLEKGACP